MDMVIAAQYLGNLEAPEGNNSRFLYLARMLKERGHEVEIVTSSFFHEEKRLLKQPPKELYGCPLTVLPEPGYLKNISLRRIYSHRVLSKALRRYLKKRKKPDVLYAAVPSLSLGTEAAAYCKKAGVPFVIDVQDLWPEAFEMVFRVPVLSDLLYAPLRRQANFVYRQADAVAAVSETFAQRALSVNKKAEKSGVVYLGTELKAFDAMKAAEPAVKKPEGEIWLGYVGTLGNSYQVQKVLEAMDKLKKAGRCEKLRFIVMGEGENREKLEAFSKDRQLAAIFTGQLPYPQMVSTLCLCDFAVNPIRKGAASIINKVGDYAAAALGVINTQECEEYKRLLREYGAGIHCENGDGTALERAIETLYAQKERREAMGQGNRRLAEERFDRGASYETLCALTEQAGERKA